MVRELLGYLGVKPEQQIALPPWHYTDDKHPAGSQIPLQEVLTYCYDLRLASFQDAAALHGILANVPWSGVGQQILYEPISVSGGFLIFSVFLPTQCLSMNMWGFHVIIWFLLLQGAKA